MMQDERSITFQMSMDSGEAVTYHIWTDGEVDHALDLAEAKMGAETVFAHSLRFENRTEYENVWNHI